MGLGSSRSVEIEICNRTRNITLMNPRTFLGLGYCSERPQPELSPGGSDTCSFWGDPVLLGVMGTTSVSGILVYEAESFTLAIYFYNPCDVNQFSMKLGLELSPGKAHLGKLGATYDRMANGTHSSSDRDMKFNHKFVRESHGTARLSHGPIKVTATMSNNMSSKIKVVLEGHRQYWEEIWDKCLRHLSEDEIRSYEEEYAKSFPERDPQQ
ncbi:uncharacterized protein LOC141726706 [Zonotrichia albicollis]|uniref:uncharacterized protein LOC141726706 n=1 Tax=Zonotrichia albicollis TaxID=44394 RepID=UPI003D812053